MPGGACSLGGWRRKPAVTTGTSPGWVGSSRRRSYVRCGVIDGPKPLSVRTWTCRCGAVHDRDRNAADNILAAGQAERRNACGVRVRPEPVPAPCDEAGTHRQTATV
ncbi:zinc ribbon domain-containing protein [Nocardia sp. NPDC049526]|uniref:zinc ribbon domain-containing protein n=1 Tax=Nocardia sp. NPDC049526 TaxID=3364316 RepID=UPI00378B7CF0